MSFYFIFKDPASILTLMRRTVFRAYNGDRYHPGKSRVILFITISRWCAQVLNWRGHKGNDYIVTFKNYATNIMVGSDIYKYNKL